VVWWPFSFLGPDCISDGDYREKLRPRVPLRALKNRAVGNGIAVAVDSPIGIFQRSAHLGNLDNGTRVHSAFYLLNDFIDRVSVSQHPALVDVPAEKLHLRNDWRKVVLNPKFVDRGQLVIRQLAYLDDLGSSEGDNFLQVGADYLDGVLKKRH